jgi:hypothetical protein
MPTDSQKVDLLFKALQGKAESSPNKRFFEEALARNAAILVQQIWSESKSIPAIAPTASDTVVTYFESLPLQEDLTVAGSKAWLSNLTDFIPDTVGSSYRVRVYQSNGTEVPPTDTSDWLFDYPSGVLTFFGNNANHSKPYHIKAWRYVGKKGVDASSEHELMAIVTENLLPGDFVNIYFNGTTRQARKADASKAYPCNGFVSEGYSTGQTAIVYTSGLNTKANLSNFTSAQLGQPAVLSSTAGHAQYLYEDLPGYISQILGTLVDLGSSATILLDIQTHVNL